MNNPTRGGACVEVTIKNKRSCRKKVIAYVGQYVSRSCSKGDHKLHGVIVASKEPRGASCRSTHESDSAREKPPRQTPTMPSVWRHASRCLGSGETGSPKEANRVNRTQVSKSHTIFLGSKYLKRYLNGNNLHYLNWFTTLVIINS